MAAKLRLGVIGCGFYAQNHLNAWRELGAEVDLAAVCDVDTNKAKAAAARFAVSKAYTDARQMLESEKLDFVDIVTTMPTHRGLVLLAAEYKTPVIVQKPFAPTWEDCVAMVAACEKAGVPLMVHENFRFQAPMIEAKRLLSEGAIGEITWGRVNWRTAYDIYAGQPYLAKETRFILLDIGVHSLDLARLLIGEAERVYCETQSLKPGIAGEDAATCTLRHRFSAVSVVDFSYAARRDPDPFPESLLEIEGRRGSLIVSPGLELTLHADGKTSKHAVQVPLRSWMSERWYVSQQSVVDIQRHWVECFRAGREPDTSGRDNLKTYALVEAAYESAATHRAVTPKA